LRVDNSVARRHVLAAESLLDGSFNLLAIDGCGYLGNLNNEARYMPDEVESGQSGSGEAHSRRSFRAGAFPCLPRRESPFDSLSDGAGKLLCKALVGFHDEKQEDIFIMIMRPSSTNT
jgi:hypothetical protein